MKAEKIKNALHTGQWNDSTGVIYHIDQKEITFKELLNAGAFNKQILSRIDIPTNYVVEWVIHENINIHMLQDYFPINQFQNILIQYEEIIQKEREKERQEHLNKIRQNSYQDHEIKALVHNNSLTRDDILNNTHITHHILTEIMGDQVERLIPPLLPPPKDVNVHIEGRTDVFTFGVVGSGKSLFLGSMFKYAHSEGLLEYGNTDMAAIKYTNFLIDAIGQGRPILGNEADYTLYLPITFRSKNPVRFKKNRWTKATTKKKFHPFNFIEMSGEHFVDIWSENETIDWLKKYLFKSKNKKIFFFAIDYFIHHTNSEGQLEASQSAQFENVLNLLHHSNLLGDTIAICLLITKWDLSSNPSVEAAREFLDSNYKNLYSTCKHLSDNQKDLDFEIFVFSIGDVRNSGSYIYNSSSSSTIYDWLCDTSYYELRD